MKYRRIFPGALSLVVLSALASGCSEGAERNPTDDENEQPSGTGGEDSATELCSSDADCDNGVFCDGEEWCAPADKDADDNGCITGEPIACEASAGCANQCVEQRRECVVSALDEDGDGHDSAECDATPGDDCDDDDNNRFPGNTEVCDFDGHDEDCEPNTIGGEDFDRDGEVDVRCCNVGPDGDEVCGRDCDDLRENVAPSSSEVCDGFDNDCDGDIDEGVTVTGYVDADHDLVGALSEVVQICAGTSGYSTVPNDCDDGDPQRSPLYAEACDGIDNDCDSFIDEDPRPVPWYDEQDADVYGAVFVPPVIACAPPDDTSSMIGLDCDDSDDAIGPFAVEQCDGLDNNCNGFAEYRIAPGDYEDDDGDRVPDVSCDDGTDCDDEDPTTFPGASERADGRDNDCNGVVDDQVVALLPWYKDEDGDGFGLTSAIKNAAMPPVGFAALSDDCNDDDPAVTPFAREECNAVDDNCNGMIDEGAVNLSGGACLVCGAGTWDADQNAATTCALWTECEEGEYISVAGSAKSDQECAACLDGSFSMAPNSAACQVHDTCEGQTLVTPGTTTTDAVCECVPGSWDHDADGETACEAWTPCSAGEYISTVGSATSDQVCELCADGAWDHDQDAETLCAPWTECVAGQYVSEAGDSAFDQECTACPPDTFSSSVNQESCQNHSTCASGEQVVSAGTPTTNTVCTSCGGCPTDATCEDGTRDYCSCDAGFRGLGTGQNLVCVPDCESEGLSCTSSESCYIVGGVSACVSTATTCLTIRNAGAHGGSGTYEIDPDGAGGAAPFDAFCDMETEGGGWTLIRESRGPTTISVEGLPNGSGADVHLSPARMMAIANQSTQVLIYDAPTVYTYSDPGLQLMTNLRAGGEMYTGSGVPSDWNGPMATSVTATSDCGNVGNYPSGVFHSCSNCWGIHWSSYGAAWSCDGWKTDKMAMLFR